MFNWIDYNLYDSSELSEWSVDCPPQPPLFPTVCIYICSYITMRFQSMRRLKKEETMGGGAGGDTMWYCLNSTHVLVVLAQWTALNDNDISNWIKLKNINIKRMTTFHARKYFSLCELCVRAATPLSTELLTDPSNNGGFPSWWSGTATPTHTISRVVQKENFVLCVPWISLCTIILATMGDI